MKEKLGKTLNRKKAYVLSEYVLCFSIKAISDIKRLHVKIMGCVPILFVGGGVYLTVTKACMLSLFLIFVAISSAFFLSLNWPMHTLKRVPPFFDLEVSIEAS